MSVAYIKYSAYLVKLSKPEPASLYFGIAIKAPQLVWSYLKKHELDRKEEAIASFVEGDVMISACRRGGLVALSSLCSFHSELAHPL